MLVQAGLGGLGEDGDGFETIGVFERRGEGRCAGAGLMLCLCSQSDLNQQPRGAAFETAMSTDFIMRARDGWM